MFLAILKGVGTKCFHFFKGGCKRSQKILAFLEVGRGGVLDLLFPHFLTPPPRN